MYPISNERNNKANSFEKISSVRSFYGAVFTLQPTWRAISVIIIIIIFVRGLSLCKICSIAIYETFEKKELKSQCCVREEWDQRGNDIEDKH